MATRNHAVRAAGWKRIMQRVKVEPSTIPRKDLLEEFRQRTGYADLESKVRFPHLHSLGGGDENKISKQNQNRETPVMND